MYIIGIDTGGTFTDCVGMADGRLHIYKCLSTPENPAEAVLQGMEALAAHGPPTGLVHGTTVATNALLERKGGRVALLTTEGFRDLIDIGRQNRPALYDLDVTKPESLVPADRRFEIRERVGADGQVIVPLDCSPEKLQALPLGDTQAVAVCFLFSYLHPEHELQVADWLRQQGMPVSASCEVLPEYREFERFATTIANAYLQPVLQTYMDQLAARLPSIPCRIIQSNGGSLSIQAMRQRPVMAALSGPAAGVVGAFALARRAGLERLITFDMGGTSTDVALCDGEWPLTSESVVAGVPLKVPMMAIHTVGAGGGSIAELDAGGALRVGPRSAGARPGPMCYGVQNQWLTVTDAHLYLGRLLPAYFLGGEMALDSEPLAAAFADLGQRLGCSPHQAALGLIQVANANMERAMRVVSVDKGFDPADFTLVCFGGAGGLHACDLAGQLNIATILVPPCAGVLSALGMLLADTIRDYSLTVLQPFAGLGPERLAELFRPLEQQASADFAADSAQEQIRFDKSLDLRYQGQSFELTVPFSPESAEAFHQLHQQRYGYHRLSQGVELVTLRLRAIVPTSGLHLPEALTAEPGSPRAVLETRQVYLDEGWCTTPVYLREKLGPGQVFPGPALVVETSATILVRPEYLARVDDCGNLLLERQPS